MKDRPLSWYWTHGLKDCKNHAEIDGWMYTRLFQLAGVAIIFFTSVNVFG
jgi:hypothetical protein